VIGYDASNTEFDVTSNYVLPSSSGIQGAYIDLPVGQETSKFEFLLVGDGTSYSYAALSEIEIFAEESPDKWRYTCLLFDISIHV